MIVDEIRNFPRIRKNLKIGLLSPLGNYSMLEINNFSCGGISVVSNELRLIQQRYTVYIPYMIRNGLHVLTAQAEPTYSIYDMHKKQHTHGLKFVEYDVQTFNRLEYLAEHLHDCNVDEINRLFEQQCSNTPIT